MEKINLTLFKQLTTSLRLSTVALGSLLLLEALGGAGCAQGSAGSKTSASGSVRGAATTGEQAGARRFLVSEPSKNFKPLTVNVVAILPLSADFGVGLAPEDLERFTAKLVREFELRTSLDVRNTAAVEELRRAVQALAEAQQPQRTRAAAVGKKLDVQGVLYAQITRFVESDGSKLGASKTGAAGFRIWLVDPRTEAVLWTATYDERDEPLSDNLLRVPGALRHGLRFHSAEELLGRGFVAAAEGLERLRREGQSAKP